MEINNLCLYLSPIILLALYSTILHLLNKFRNLPPSPFPALPFVGHIYLLKKPFHRGLSEVSRRFGPAIFLQLGSRPVLLISSPSLAEECLTKKNDIIFANRPNLLNGRYFGYNYTSLSWAPYGDHWRNLRRISSLELLSSQRIQMLSYIRADEAMSLVRKLVHVSIEEPDKVLEVKSALFEFSFNVLTRMITGKRYYGKNVENSKEAKILEEIAIETSKVAFETNVVDFLPLMRWFGFKDLEKKLISIHEKRDKFMQNVIDENRREVLLMENNECTNTTTSVNHQVKTKKTKKNMVEVLLDLQRSEPDYYTDETIKNLLLVRLFQVLLQGGSSTSTIALEWAFSLLLDNPETLKKAQSEIDARVGFDRLITETDVAALPYLRHVVLETLRLHPPVSILMPHRSSAECTVGGFRIPANTILLVNIWDIHHNPEIWPDPEEFRPERFEGFDGKKELGFRFFPFGSGRRACPGENLGISNIGLGLGSLIQCFDWEKIGEIDMSEGAGTTTPKVQPLTARCKPRHFLENFIS
ncbi:PREDICTED: cytochrome P450 81E8-like [Erythranthe guttata]|uniref:cytochrome P450 81E8-like n=1 Tax=Erythranthe guttata TaxID=4155 RepID=UPI00064E052C|nr:PREDICTED: cytochrome P450 81E8-like [Erythranthe guttata]|eukprot:XP_012831740.1 PREDICTED: cytochrome P450 81E8-like [Erythranthe guttata]